MDDRQPQADGWTQPEPDSVAGSQPATQQPSGRHSPAEASPTTRLNYTPASAPSQKQVRMSTVVAVAVAGVLLFACGLIAIVFAVVPGVWAPATQPERSAIQGGSESAPIEQQAVPASVLDEDTGPTVELAKSALKAEEPTLYRRITDPDEPRVRDRRGNKAYTWEYLDAGSSTARVRQVTVTLDPEGKLVDIERD